MDRLKLLVKNIGIRVVAALGPIVPTVMARSWLCDKIVPYLMDPRVLPRGLAERPTRNFNVSVLCDPYLYVHRKGYWCGVFYEEELERYLLRNVDPGDTVIDVGMNVGHVTIPAAVRVGQLGKVLAFEPNARVAQQVAALAQRQHLNNIEVLSLGLGNAAGSFVLNMEPAHPGGATFRTLARNESYNVQMHCEIGVGDEILKQYKLTGRVFLKMDVEGFEVEALQGLSKTLKRVDHAVVEVSPDWIKAPGVALIFKIMLDAGLQSYRLEERGIAGCPLSAAEVLTQMNVLFRRGPAR